MSEPLCQLCREDGDKVEAFGFCLDCCDCLCEDCYKGHRKQRSTRNHTLLDKEQMLKDKDTLPTKDSVVDICQHHSETVKYFCPDHDSVGCSVCVTIDHKICENIVHIPQAADGIADSEEYKTLERNIDETSNRFENIIPAATKNISKSDASSTQVAQEISAYMDAIIATIRKLEDAVRNTADQCHQHDVQRMNAFISKSKEALERLKTMKSSMHSLSRMKQHKKLFIAIKSNNKELRQMQEELAEWESSSYVRVSRFDSNATLSKCLGGLDRLGDVLHNIEGHEDSVESSSTDITEVVENLDVDQQKITATYQNDICIKSKSDKGIFSSVCNVSAMAALAEDRVVLVCDAGKADNPDSGHKVSLSKVALLDTKHNRIHSELVVPGRCCSVIKINESHVALGLGDFGNTLLKIDPTITVVRRLGSSDGGHLSLFNNEIYVSTRSHIVTKVDIYGRQSIIVESKPSRADTSLRQTFFASALYESNSHHKMYSIVAHSNKCSGERWFSPDEKSKYLGCGVVNTWVSAKVVLPKLPESITMSADGKLLFVLACDVIYVVRTGTMDAVVLLGEEDEISRVSAVAFCCKSRQLIVGMHECNYVKVYQVSGTF